MPNMKWEDCPCFVLPFLYDVQANTLCIAEKKEQHSNVATSVANIQLRRFVECGGVSYNECSLFPAIRDILANFAMPNEPQPPIPIQNQVSLFLFYYVFLCPCQRILTKNFQTAVLMSLSLICDLRHSKE